MLCQKILLIVLCLLLCICAKSDAMNFTDELAIIKGLSKRKVLDRRPYIYKTYKTNSKAIFDKLARMYKSNKEDKDDVFYAMKVMNIYSKGKFCKPLLEAMKCEFLRLQKRKEQFNPELFYLGRCFSIFMTRSFDGFDGFVKDVYINYSKYIEFSENFERDKEHFQALCVLYFARKNRRGYMKKLAEVFKKDTIGCDTDIISLFTLHKDPSVYDIFEERLLKAEDFYVGSMFEYYIKYSKAINKRVSSKIKKRYDTYIKELSYRTRDLFGDN